MGSATGYARLTAATARMVLAAWLLVAAFCVGVTLSPLKSGFADAPPRGPSDVLLYLAEAQRIQRGESYYEVAAEELRSRGYPTRSLFNWRTPLPMWLIGRLPDMALGRALLGFLALGLLILSYAVVAELGTVSQGLGCVLCMIGALLPCVLGDLYVMPELWSGVLIGLSVCAYGINRPGLGLAAGLAALFFRELAGPYCALCLALAVWQRRRAEAALWLVGLAAYAIFFAWHASTVFALLGPHETAHDHGWVRFGGTAFVISTCQMNAWLLLLPQWVTAVYFMLSLLGLAGWQAPAGQRIGLAVALYVMLFSIVGQPFNQYWGSLFAPLLCLGVARAPASLADLWRTAGAPVWRGRPLTAGARTR